MASILSKFRISLGILQEGGCGIHHSNFTVCTEGDVQLIGGRDPLSGRVELCRQNEWGRICDRTSTWGLRSATVVCRQLGFSTEGTVIMSDAYEELALNQTKNLVEAMYVCMYRNELFGLVHWNQQQPV